MVATTGGYAMALSGTADGGIGGRRTAHPAAQTAIGACRVSIKTFWHVVVEHEEVDSKVEGPSRGTGRPLVHGFRSYELRYSNQVSTIGDWRFAIR